MTICNLVRLAQTDYIKQFSTGDVIVEEGSTGDAMFLIVSGAVDVYKNYKDNKILVEKLYQGDFFGEQALVEGVPYDVTVQAKDETTVIVITNNNFEKIIKQKTSFVFKIIKGLSRRLRKRNEEITKFKYKKYKLKSKEEGNFTKKDIKVNKEVDEKNEVLNEKAIQNLTTIFPPNHKIYSYTTKEVKEDIFYTKKITCPICLKKFTTKGIRFSKLSLEKMEYDFRRVYVNFDPLWYIIWVCPYCNYANFLTDFEKIYPKEKVFIQNKLESLSENIYLNEKRDINEVFLTYYLALYCAKETIKKAKIWLRLSWLYHDVKDEKMYEYASKEALKYFKEFYYKTNKKTSVVEDQQICYLLGELLLRQGDIQEARKHFFNSIVHRGGNPMINRWAQIRLDDLKKDLKTK